MAAELAEFGVSVQADRIARKTACFEVWPENWPSVTAFLGCQTQWRTEAIKDRIVMLGLDYGAVEIVLRRFKSPDHVFDDVQFMERVALTVFREAD